MSEHDDAVPEGATPDEGTTAVPAAPVRRGRPLLSAAFFLTCTASAALIGFTAGGGLKGVELPPRVAEVLGQIAPALTGLAADPQLNALRVEHARLDTELRVAADESQKTPKAQSFDDRLALMRAEQSRLQGRIDRAEAHRAQVEEKLADAATALDRLTEDSRRADAVALANAEALATARAAITALRFDLAEAEADRDALSRTLETLAGTMEAVIAERDAASARAAELDARITSLAEERERTLTRLEDAARVGLGGMRRMLENSGLDVDRILGETREDYNGAGGPFEALEDTRSDAGSSAAVRTAALMSDLEELSLMRFAAKRLPFGAPVERARLTSGFGPRRDPLGRGRAMHKGIDFAGPRGTRIRATADGVVTFAGVQRGYGRIVIVRHAFGVETRYAHLHRTHVKVGDRVGRGDHIADMGNTGRSTGVHLHYEIRVDREAVNPSRFLKADTDVL